MKIADKDVRDNADEFDWFCSINGYSPRWLKLMIPVLIEAWKNNDNNTVDKIKKELFIDGRMK